MNIGDRVAIVRKDAGLNQEEFSQRLMVSRSHISNIEKGRKELSASLRKLLCMEFFVNEDWLLTGEGERYNQAAKDVLDLEDAGRGQKDRFGREKAVALQSAAWLYSIYPNVAASCSSVEQLLMLFGDAEFCELFNMIAVMYILKVAGRGEMYDAIKLLASQVSNLGNLDELLNRADRILSHLVHIYTKRAMNPEMVAKVRKPLQIGQIRQIPTNTHFGYLMTFGD